MDKVEVQPLVFNSKRIQKRISSLSLILIFFLLFLITKAIPLIIGAGKVALRSLGNIYLGQHFPPF